jgi:hypothetical protein
VLCLLAHHVPKEWIEQMDDETMFGWVVACVRYDGFRDYDFVNKRWFKQPERKE